MENVIELIISSPTNYPQCCKNDLICKGIKVIGDKATITKIN